MPLSMKTFIGPAAELSKKWEYRIMNPISKWKSSKGETMAESLCSILIIALSSSIFLNFVIISGRIMDRAKKREKAIHTATAFLETMEEDTYDDSIIEKRNSGELTVSIKAKSGRTITKEHFTVNVYYSPYGAVYK